MSAISEKVQAALFTKLNVSAVTTAGATGVYESKAPSDASTPFVLFNRQAPGAVVYAFGAPTHVLEQDLWLIKAVVSEGDSTTQSPQALAEDIAQACETAVGNTLTLSGNTVVWCARFADMPGFEERQNDRYVYHRGFLLSVATR